MKWKVLAAVLGAVFAFAAVFGVARTAWHASEKGELAEAAGEADGGPQAPFDALRVRALGGAKTISRAQIARAVAQSRAIAATPGTWEYVGANNIGGRVTDVVVDPTQPNTIYISSAGGGVWKSTDAGMT